MSLVVAWERSIKSMCPLGLWVHHLREEKWQTQMSPYKRKCYKNKANCDLHCAGDANTFTYVSFSGLWPRDKLLLACSPCSAQFLLQSVSEHRGEMDRWETRERSEQYQKKNIRGKAPHMLECRRWNGDKRGWYEQTVKKADFTAEDEGESKRPQNATAGGGSTHLVGCGAILEAC